MGGDGGLLGGISQTLFGDSGAGAAQSAAEAQQRAAGANYNQIKSIGEQMTTQGLLNYDKALQASDRNLQRQEQMIAQIDPTVLEASKQALKLLKGESAPALAPAQQQRQMQRQQLLNTLREQLGPGAETSTAGIQALNRFDSETNSLLGQQQQSALQGINQTFNTFGSYSQQLNPLISQYADITNARAGLQSNYANLLNQASAPVQQTAGAQYTGAVLRGQQNAAFGQQLFGGALAAGGAYLGGLGIGKAAAGAGAAAGNTLATAGQNYKDYGNYA